MFQVTFSPEITAACPELLVGVIEADVQNTPFCEPLWQEIDALADRLMQTETTESIKRMPGIEATRQAYRRLGKDPSRYRPSNEALMRRVVSGKGLYKVNTLADIGNLVSMRYGYSLGVFDADQVSGTAIQLGVGREGEPYEGIGRGQLNIASLPVYRDAVGGIGTPTSDNERTKVLLQTRRVLVFINAYDGNETACRAAQEAMLRSLRQYAAATDESSYLVAPPGTCLD